MGELCLCLNKLLNKGLLLALLKLPNYLAKGKYIFNGDKILCSYTNQNNNKELVLI